MIKQWNRILSLSLMVFCSCALNQEAIDKRAASNNMNGLHDIWVLTLLNDMPVTDVNDAGAPTLEVHVSDRRVIGFAGCNNFQGALEDLSGEKVEFGMLLSTKKYCPEMKIEDDLLIAISGNSFVYRIEDQHLFLMNDKTSLTFKKVD